VWRLLRLRERLHSPMRPCGMSGKRPVHSNISFGVNATISSMRRFRQRRCPWPVGASFQTDGLVSGRLMRPRLSEIPTIGRSVPIVAETEQIRNRRNSPLNSRAQFFDGLVRRFFVLRGKNLYKQINALWSVKTIEWE
jgi:hypothetical protein